jgi:thiamine biosynthesis lipoprotein
MSLIHLQRPAMATVFEMWLAGDDPEHLEAVAQAALDEVERIERLLSRFDPAAEVARVNRSAGERAVQVEYELFALLEDCRLWLKETEGFFDVCAVSGVSLADAVQMDIPTRTVRFLDPRVQLDFGALGKGYALDAAAHVLDRFGVTSALLHGGTSSVRAIGLREDRSPWPVGIRDPFTDEEREILQLPLSDCGLSTSGVVDRNANQSDVLDPVAGRQLSEQAACVVIAENAVEAEVLSTALLAMGKSRATKYLETKRPSVAFRVLWVEQTGQDTVAHDIYSVGP